MSEFVRVAKAKRNSGSRPRKRWKVEDRLVVLFHVAGEIYCLDDVCTHVRGRWARGRCATTPLLSSAPARNLTFAPARSCRCRATESDGSRTKSASMAMRSMCGCGKNRRLLGTELPDGSVVQISFSRRRCDASS